MCKLYFSVNQIMLWFLFEIHVYCSLKHFNSDYCLIIPAQSGFCLISCPFEFPGCAGQFFKLSNIQGTSLNCGNCSKLDWCILFFVTQSFTYIYPMP